MLSAEQLKYLQNILLTRLDEINEQLDEGEHFGNEWAHAQQSVGELSNYDNHSGDTGTELYEREKDIALNEHIEQERNEIHHALHSIHEGTYGKCEVCQKPIPYERLEVLPTARCCIKHTKERALSKDRPIEEEVLVDPLHAFDVSEEANYFDGEDAFQAVQRYGTSDTPSDFFDNTITNYNDLTIEDDEGTEGVEAFENFIGTDIEGRNLTVYPTELHEKYESQLDEDDVRFLEEMGLDFGDFDVLSDKEQ
ncbi:TraR/DksA C4-type zinc finger protein [Bacillus tianshenii]|nr:TraR/DksA C4-type zinc finger protein [Bacillus tianshenii]